MTIIYLHQYFVTPDRSGGTRSYEFARRLVQWGHEVHMVTSDTRTQPGVRRRWRQYDADGVHVHALPVPYSNKMSYRERLRAFASFALQAGPYAARLPGNVVFATSTPLTIAIPGRYAARKKRIPMVFEVRDLWPELPIAMGALRNPLMIAAARRLERFAYRHASHVVALSPGMRDGVVKAGYPKVRVTVIPNSADLGLFDVPPEAGESFRQEHGWLGERPLIVYAGTLGPINGVDYLVRLAAAARAEWPEVRFLIVGEGRQEGALRGLAKELDVLDRSLFMVPPVPKAEMPRVLSAASIVTSLFVDLPAMWANSANKFFDALAAGRPIAINYRGWQAELIEEHACGAVLPPADVGQGARMLCEALEDAEWTQRAGSQARRLAEQEFDRDKLARKLERVLSDVVRGP